MYVFKFLIILLFLSCNYLLHSQVVNNNEDVNRISNKRLIKHKNFDDEEISKFKSIRKLNNINNIEEIRTPLNIIEPQNNISNTLNKNEDLLKKNNVSPDTIPVNSFIETIANSITNNELVPITKPKRPSVKIPTEVHLAPEDFDKGILAPPANDAICSANTLPIDGTCLNGQTNIQATADYYGGCVWSTDRSVWFTFTLTGANDQLDVTFSVPGTLGAPSLGNGGEIYLLLLEGPCTSPTGIIDICDLPSTTFTFDGLTAGTTYFLLVATTVPNTGNFNICGTQSIAPIGNQTGPEQDCKNAIILCNPTYSFSGSYTGWGDDDEVATSTCLSSGETNSVWYVFTPQTAGTFGFNIVTTKDYDFALYDITTIGCAGIPTATPIRCNYSATYGNTGLTVPGSTQVPSLSVNSLGSPTMNGVSNITAGNTYALIIDNWSSDNNGFDIDFLGTSTVTDPTAPTMVSAVPSCSANTIMLTMSEAIKCLTVNQNDFKLIYVTGGSADVSSKITSIIAYNCPGDLTPTIQITHDGTLATGVYTIEINPSPVLADKCDNIIVAGSTIGFNYLSSVSLTPSVSILCDGSTLTLDANGADGTPSVTTYTLSPGGLTNTTDGIFSGLTPIITTTYTISVTYGGCTRTATTTVTVEVNIVTSSSPLTKTVCGFPPDVQLTASTTINGSACAGCTYAWSTSDGSFSSATNIFNPTVDAAGTYTVTATTTNGCNNTNSPSSIVTLASSGTGGGTCDVIYVSPAGGGDGYTKGAPTTLSDAITKAQCSYTIIKMQVGVYSITNYQTVNSYNTIEGGYNIGFTEKTSNMSGDINSTTIQRSTALDDGAGTECSAFKVANNAELFRIQDIRIEMPGAASGFATHGAGTNRTNYGIKLGTGCNNYNIVRCYIDAGAGSAP